MQMMPIHVRDSDGVEIYYNPELRTSSTYTEVRDRHVAVIWLSGMPPIQGSIIMFYIQSRRG